VPEVPIWLSLSVIVATLAVTTVASLAKTRRDVRRAGQATGLPPG
jgi:tellurite resistance protein TerC